MDLNFVRQHGAKLLAPNVAEPASLLALTGFIGRHFRCT